MIRYDIDFAHPSLSHHSFSRHFHDHFVIELVTKGADRFYCEKGTYTARSNGVVLINPGEIHTGCTVFDAELEYYSLYPGLSALQKIAEVMEETLPVDFVFRERVIRRPTTSRLLLSLFMTMDPCRKDSLGTEEMFYGCMYESLFDKQKQVERAIPILKDPRINLAIDFIQTHFRERLSLQQLSSMARLNPFHFSRLFRRTTGSPHMITLSTPGLNMQGNCFVKDYR